MDGINSPHCWGKQVTWMGIAVHMAGISSSHELVKQVTWME